MDYRHRAVSNGGGVQGEIALKCNTPGCSNYQGEWITCYPDSSSKHNIGGGRENVIYLLLEGGPGPSCFTLFRTIDLND